MNFDCTVDVPLYTLNITDLNGIGVVFLTGLAHVSILTPSCHCEYIEIMSTEFT